MPRDGPEKRIKQVDPLAHFFGGGKFRGSYEKGGVPILF